MGASALAVTALAFGTLVAPVVAYADEVEFVTEPAQYVNPFIGTARSKTAVTVAEINNNPGPATPFGMIQSSPDTQDSYSGYMFTNDTITGFSLTHMAAGCYAMGDVPMLPTTKVPSSKDSPQQINEKFSHDDETAEAGYYQVRLKDSDVNVEMTATNRVAANKYDFPNDGKTGYLYVNLGDSKTPNFATQINIDPATNTITGSTKTGEFCGKGNRYTIYFAAKFDTPFESYGTYNGNDRYPGQSSITGTSSGGGWVTFPAGANVESRVAASFVSTANALENLEAEAPLSKPFDTIRDDSWDRWNEVLGEVRVAGRNQTDLTKFYTLLYHSMIHPSTFNDVNGQYIGYDGKIHSLKPGQEAQYANFSDWDTYRALTPLQAMLFPKESSDMAQTLVNAGDQMGTLPRWPVMNSATGQMTGDNVTPLIVNWYKFGAQDFDAEHALDFMVEAAETAGPANEQSTKQGFNQRPGAPIYNELGFAPQIEIFRGDHAIVGASITLEYSLDDFTISRLAKDLGKDDIAQDFQVRSQRWQNLFNPITARIAPRNLTGEFVVDNSAGFGEDGFDEGNAEQYTWMIPHNTATLINMMGGREDAELRLDQFTRKINAGSTEPYLWAGNEPGFGVPWIYNYLGVPTKTQALVQRIMNELYGPIPQGKPGNDDLGGLSSWYVWAAMGLYPITSGTATLVLNTPIFDKIEFTTSSGELISINAPGASRSMDDSPAKYIKEAKLNGQPWNKTYLPEDVALNGGTIEYVLVDDPAAAGGWGTGPDATPPSYPEGSRTALASTTDSTLAVRPGETSTTSVMVQILDGVDRPFTVDLADGASNHGLTVTPAEGQTVGGFKKVDISVSAPGDMSWGHYPLALAVKFQDGSEISVPVLVRVAEANSLFETYEFVAQAPRGSSVGTPNFDGGGNGYIVEELEKLGITPGAVLTLPRHSDPSVPFDPDLKFTWPNVPQGMPNAMMPRGQTVNFPAGVTKFSLVGAGIEGGTNGNFRVNFTDGTSQTISMGMGDWVLPASNDVSHKWPWMPERIAVTQEPGAYLLATKAHTVPEGKFVKSLVFPDFGSNQKTNKLRVIAIAMNSVEVSKEALASVTVTPAEAVYTGSAHSPAITVKAASGQTVPSSAYTVAWDGNLTAVGTHRATITAKADSAYTGSVTGQYKITPVPIALGTVELNPASGDYNGQPHNPTVTVKDVEGNTVPTSAYTVTWTGDLTAVGTHKVTVAAKPDSGYKGSATAEYVVERVSADPKNVERISGANRYATSRAVFEKFALGTGRPMYVATGQGFADALSAGPAVAKEKGTLVLINGRSPRLDKETQDLVRAAKPSKVTIIGGTSVIPNDLMLAFRQLVPSGTAISRIAERTRYATSLKVAESSFPAGMGVDTVYVATGRAYPDALSAGPAAAANDAPVILVDGKRTLDPAVVTYLTKAKTKKVVIVGGTNAVNSGIEDALNKIAGLDVTRAKGGSRYDTAVAVNETFAGRAVSEAFLATGSSFADALSGAAYAGQRNAPLYLSQRNCVPLSALNDIRSHGVDKLWLLGGKSALSEAVKALTPCPK